MKIEQIRRESRTAFEKAVADYIKSRRRRVPEFVRRHFSVKGALRINKKAFGEDLYKAPLNVAWTLPYLCLRASSSLLRKMGLAGLSDRIDALPPGFETRVRKEIDWLIYTELLELPCSQEGRVSHSDALLAEFLKQPEIAALFAGELGEIRSKSGNPGYRAALEKNLVEYSKLTSPAISSLLFMVFVFWLRETFPEFCTRSLKKVFEIIGYVRQRKGGQETKNEH